MSKDWTEGNATDGLGSRVDLNHMGTDDARLRRLEEATAALGKAIAELARQLEFVTREIRKL